MERIVHLIPRNEFTGPGIVANDIVDYLPHTVLMAMPRISVGQNKRIGLSSCSKFSFKRLLQANIIHTHGFLPDFVGFCFTLVSKKRWIVTIHNHIYEDFTPQYSLLAGKILTKIWLFILRRSNVQIVFTNSQHSYYKTLQMDNLVVIPNGRKSDFLVDNSFENQLINATSRFKDKIVLGFCGRLIERKNLIEACDLIAGNEELILFIVGDGPLKDRILDHLKDKEYKDRIVFFGHKNSPRIFYRYIDYNVLISSSEGFPLNLIEASMEGKPTLCNSIDIYDEILPDKFRFTADVHSAVALNEGLKRMIGNRIDRCELQEYAKKEFGAEAIAKRYSELYEKSR